MFGMQSVSGQTPLIEHPLCGRFLELVRECGENVTQCNQNYTEILKVGMKLSNEHSMLLLHDRAKNLFDDAIYYLHDLNPIVLPRLAHMSSSLVFSQGNHIEAKKYWQHMQKPHLVTLRTMAAQSLLTNDSSEASVLYSNLTHLLKESLSQMLSPSPNVSVKISPGEVKAAEGEETLLSWLLSEAQGGVRLTFKLSDLAFLSLPSLPTRLEESFRFSLSVGLLKLGLYDLSFRHLSLAATPWEAPLYRLRAKLVFSPVHSSLGGVAMAVNNFERQAESILLSPPPGGMRMSAICLSLNEAALALQALPLLHVVGLSAPIGHSPLGHLPTPLPIVLSEVYQRLCPPFSSEPSLSSQGREMKTKAISVGVVAGSLDGGAGKIMIGLLESMRNGNNDHLLRQFEFVALCFPTPRSAVTDKLKLLFQSSVNLSPENKTLTMERVRERGLDFVLFADAASDARVFALAHERLARYQAVLWNWGGSLGIPSVDFYLVPDLFLKEARCVLPRGDVLPQQLFKEQVLLLDGLPSLPTTLRLVTEDLWQIMRSRYLLDLGNRTNIYFLPCSVKFLHPTFDRAMEVILRTDPIATIVLAVLRTGRDSLPTTHLAVRHDILHPAMPPAAVAKFANRLRKRLGNEVNRIRYLPPLEEPIFRALQMQSVAVLDPFPVGLHEGVLEAMLDGVPVVTAPTLQECTNSHAASIGKYLQIPAYSTRESIENNDKYDDHEESHASEIPQTAEDYGVLAVRLSKEAGLRRDFTLASKAHLKNEPSHGAQLVSLISTLLS